MQKLKKLSSNASQWELDNINTDYLNKGWIIINMLKMEGGFILLLLEKAGRKEKLNHINNLQNENEEIK